MSNIKNTLLLIELCGAFYADYKICQKYPQINLQSACYFSNCFLEIKLAANCIYGRYFHILVENNIKQRFVFKENKEQ